MTKGYSLGQDLRLLINNPKYSDVEILCEDEETLHGCRAILAARSEMFDKLLYNGMKESYEKQISFPKISSPGMKIILEYIYTGSIKEESLTEDNIVETFYAADYFQLPDLQKCITKTVRDTLTKNHTENYSPELLTKVIEAIMPSTDNTDDNDFLNLLVGAVAAIPLDKIEIGRLSVPALQYLLNYTHKSNEKPFATVEYEVFRYSAILAAKQISNDAYRALMKRLPTLEKISSTDNDDNDDDNDDDDNDNDDDDYDNDYDDDYDYENDAEKIARELEPLVKFIDFKLIKGAVLTDVIDPLDIVSPKILNNAYKYKAKYSNSDINTARGVAPSLYMFKETDCVWNEVERGSHLSIMDDGKVVEASNNKLGHQSVRANITCNKGIYEWDITVEKYCAFVWIGVCSAENFDFGTFAGNQPTAWLLCSSGDCRNDKEVIGYCPPFIGDYRKVSVHLDMTKKTIAFTVDGKRYSEVSKWKNLPSKLYPVVSVCYPGRIRIEPHRDLGPRALGLKTGSSRKN